MGEIGIPRREYLYELTFWEARRITMGYRQRGVLQYQLQRIQAWASLFSNGNPERKSPCDIIPLYFDDDHSEPPISDEERDELAAMMDEMNARENRAEQ